MTTYFESLLTMADKKKAIRDLWIRGYSIAQIQTHIRMVIIPNGESVSDVCHDMLAGNYKLFYHISGMAIELVE